MSGSDPNISWKRSVSDAVMVAAMGMGLPIQVFLEIEDCSLIAQVQDGPHSPRREQEPRSGVLSKSMFFSLAEHSWDDGLRPPHLHRSRLCNSLVRGNQAADQVV